MVASGNEKVREARQRLQPDLNREMDPASHIARHEQHQSSPLVAASKRETTSLP
jgi:hypothetical protein